MESFVFDFEFLLFQFDALRRRGLTDSIIPVLVDNGSTGFAEGAGQLGGAEFEQKNEDDEIREAEDQNGADLAENGGEEFVVQKIADVASGHFSGGRGSPIQPLGPREKGIGEGGPENGSGELEKAGPGHEKDSKVEEFLGIVDFLGKKEEKATGDEDHGEEIGAEAEEKEKDAAEVGTGRAHEVSFGLLGRLGVKGEILGIEGEEGEQEKNARSENGQRNDLLAEAGSKGSGFRFGHDLKRESN